MGGSLAFALGLSNGLSRISEKLVDFDAADVRNIPNLALIPLVILWFGIDESAKLFLRPSASSSRSTSYVSRCADVRPALVEMAPSYGMTRWGLFRRVILPSALPSIFVGVRYALGIMWLTLIVAETIAANSGIGYMAMNAREFMLVDVVVLAIVIYALLGKLADSSVRILERPGPSVGIPHSRSREARHEQPCFGRA